MQTEGKGTPALGPEGLKLERAEVGHHRVTLFVRITAAGARCAVCGYLSGQIHSRYTRTVADLPCRRASYLAPSYPEVFLRAEPLRESNLCRAGPRGGRLARKTNRLEGALALVAFALEGEAGARLAGELGLRTSPDTLLRRLRRAALPNAGFQRPRICTRSDWSCSCTITIASAQKYKVIHYLNFKVRLLSVNDQLGALFSCMLA